MYYAVHYVFAHAETLDFTSLLGPPLIYQNTYHKRIIRLAPPPEIMDIMSKHLRASAILNFAPPPVMFPDYQFQHFISSIWKENVYRGVGSPTGQLTSILFHTGFHWWVDHEMWARYRYPLEDGALAVGYYTLPDDTALVPRWSTVDIDTPQESKILPWYVYRRDHKWSTDSDDDGSCDICTEIGTHAFCPLQAPKKLRLDLSIPP